MSTAEFIEGLSARLPESLVAVGKRLHFLVLDYIRHRCCHSEVVHSYQIPFDHQVDHHHYDHYDWHCRRRPVVVVAWVGGWECRSDVWEVSILSFEITTVHHVNC